MKKLTTYMGIILVLIFLNHTGCSRLKNQSPSAGFPVFPGAQGFGIDTLAGRGGTILKVTTTEDDGEGSFRAAVEAPGPRIIVFEVSGLIELQDELVLSEPFCTIAGQSAPPPGITLAGKRFRIATHDVLVQHLRIRPGDRPGSVEEIEDRDALTVQDHFNPIYNVVIDHCSLSWSLDEVIGFWGYKDKILKNCTISNSIISEALDVSLKGYSHSKGILIGDHAKNIALVGNLLSSNKDRNPLFKGHTSGVMINNLIYNAGLPSQVLFADDSSEYGQVVGPIHVSIVGNIFHDGPVQATGGPLWFNSNVSKGTKVYLSDNLCLRVDDSPCNVPWIARLPPWGNPIVLKPPVWSPSLNASPVDMVERNVLSSAGSRPAERFTKDGDSIDERIIQEVHNHRGSLKNSTAHAGGWPVIESNRRVFPIPDRPHEDDDGDGYTNIEEILHKTAQNVEKK